MVSVWTFARAEGLGELQRTVSSFPRLSPAAPRVSALRRKRGGEGRRGEERGGEGRGGRGGAVGGLRPWNVRALPILSVVVGRGLRAAAGRPGCVCVCVRAQRRDRSGSARRRQENAAGAGE